MLLVGWFLFSVMVSYEDIKNLDLKIIFGVLLQSLNIKWFLVAFIFYALAIFNLFFSSFSTATAEKALKKMQLLIISSF